MDLTKRQFDILIQCMNHDEVSQRVLARLLSLSLGSINKDVQELRRKGYLTDRNALTSNGTMALEPYRVQNAIIMAAGLSSRFAPLSYERPKGTLVVRGETLIERQIRQLKEAGIDDITVVVGYMKEHFFYLRDKYDVQIVVNEDYRIYNNPSSLIRVLDKLGNTYICSSDNYFTENVFEPYVYDSYYSTVYMEDASAEWSWITDTKNKIIAADFSPVSGWVMMGHVYFSRSFSEVFKKLLPEQFGSSIINSQVWEFFLAQNLDSLTMHTRRYPSHVIYEFDSLEDLRKFDPKYLADSNSTIFANICSVLDCSESAIQNIEVVKKGLTNLSFTFTVGNEKYIYRHPGINSERFVSRQGEVFAERAIADLGFPSPLIYIDPETGWKLSRFLEDYEDLDYDDIPHSKEAIRLLRNLHQANLNSPVSFGLWNRTEKLMESIPEHILSIEGIRELYADISLLHVLTEADNVTPTMCHNDTYAPNFMHSRCGRMVLIDWEYSGNEDPWSDVGGFIVSAKNYSDETVDELLREYLGRELNHGELCHAYALIAITAFHWFAWSLFQESNGMAIGEYQYIWFTYAKKYASKAQSLYRMKES